MALVAGSRLGRYEIISQIGAGGMGEVFRASDTRLGRTVAIKVLRPHAPERPEVRQRFEREAQVISSLNHPHICTLHDIGTHDGILYLVMEYLEGKTLAKRLKAGALSIQETLSIAIEVSDALACAHRSGIVHRDLKPENIMLTVSGAKILDFGIAKFCGHGATTAEASNSETLTSPLTIAGCLIGTPAYMTPEQLSGRDADTRTDIFAFGAVLYEMLSGHRAFDEPTAPGLAAAILTKDPAPLQFAPALSRLVKKSLEKDPERRWQTAADLRDELEWIRSAGSADTTGHKRTFAATLPLISTAVAVGMSCVAAVLFFRGVPPETGAQVTRFTISAPAGTSLTDFDSQISPDGQKLAFVARREGRRILYVRPLSSVEAVPLTGTEGASSPFWSPDSLWITFVSNGMLRRIRIDGGPAESVCRIRISFARGAWIPGNRIAFTPDFNHPIYQVAASGGEPAPLTNIDTEKQQSAHYYPDALPDGRRFLFYAFGKLPQYSGTYVGSMDSKDQRLLIQGIGEAIYRAPGYLIYPREGTLFGQRFDTRSLESTGEPKRLAENLLTNPIGHPAEFSASLNGILAYRTALSRGRRLTWMDRHGNRLKVTSASGEIRDPRISPDGSRVLYWRFEPGREGGGDIWMLDLDRDISSRVTFTGQTGTSVWSPDGSRIAFSTRAGIAVQPVIGIRASEDLYTVPPGQQEVNDWSPDGQWIVYEARSAPGATFDLWLLPTDNRRGPEVLRRSDFNERQARFSPDSKLVAYTSDESGRSEIFVQALSDPAERWQISSQGGYHPRWRHDGRELFYLSPDGNLMGVELTLRPRLKAGAPYTVFDADWTDQRNSYYDSAHNGQRFLIVSTVYADNPPPITVLTNWQALVQR